MSNYNWAIDDFHYGPTDRVRVAVKDLIDLEGRKTSAGSRLVLSRATACGVDAACISQLHKSEVAVIGKSNLVELAFGTSGINPWWNTPVNPLNPTLIPGGSSSGSAVSVAANIADIALGTDTGGSIRIPATACGIVGLKPTWSRISTKGVWPLAPSLDTVGPMARRASELLNGLSYFFDNFTPAIFESSIRIGLMIDTQPREMTRVFRALFDELKWNVMDVTALDMINAHHNASLLLGSEAFESNRSLLNEAHRLDPIIAGRLKAFDRLSHKSRLHIVTEKERWAKEVSAVLENVDVLALATIPFRIPPFKTPYSVQLNLNTLPFNFSGHPALTVPISLDFSSNVLGGHQSPQGGSIEMPIPISLQLVGQNFQDERLLSIASLLERRDLCFLSSNSVKSNA